MKIANKIFIAVLLTGLILTGFIIIHVHIGVPSSVLFVIALAVTSVLGWFISKIFSGPIEKLCESVKIIQAGHLEHRSAMESKDEIGELSRALDDVVKRLREAFISINNLKKEKNTYNKTISELRENEEYFRQLFEYSNDAVFIYDLNSRILNVNKRACGMLGYTREELLKKTFLELHTEEELTRSKAAFKTESKTYSVRFESQLKRKDGAIIDVEISSSLVNLEKGIAQGIVCNITERKRLEAALRESEEKFRTFMETANDLMFITDEKGVFTYVNEAMANTLGYSKEEIGAMHLSDVIDKEALEGSKIKREELLAEGENIHELVWETKNRRKIYGEMRAVGIYSAKGLFKGMRGIFRDITERRKVEESQRLAQLGELAADVAHEVNTPVAVIIARAELSLMEGSDEKDLKKNLRIIIDQCNQAKDIVKRLLMFSKPSKGDFKKGNIHDPINLVIDLIGKQFLCNNIKINKKFNQSLPQVVMDEKQMQEVLMNLMRNSSDAMPDGGSITISTYQDGMNIRIDITDTGQGIAELDLHKIFDPFFTTKENGTGLGLSVCYGIIKAHGGDLRYTSKLGEGTTASILLPLERIPE